MQKITLRIIIALSVIIAALMVTAANAQTVKPVRLDQKNSPDQQAQLFDTIEAQFTPKSSIERVAVKNGVYYKVTLFDGTDAEYTLTMFGGDPQLGEFFRAQDQMSSVTVKLIRDQSAAESQKRKLKKGKTQNAEYFLVTGYSGYFVHKKE